MKRGWYALAAGVWIAVLLLPLTVELSGSSVRLGLQIAGAVNTKQTDVEGGGAAGGAPGPVVSPPSQVCIALPILKANGSKCLPNSSGNGSAILQYMKAALRLFSIVLGMVIVLMIVLSGVQYITSTADPARVKSAKSRLEGAVLALVLFMCMYAIINFLVPGGIL